MIAGMTAREPKATGDTPSLDIVPSELRTQQLMYGMFVAIRSHTQWANLMPLVMVGVTAFIGSVSPLIWYLIAAQLIVVIYDTVRFKQVQGDTDTPPIMVSHNPMFSATACLEGALWGLMMLPFAETLGTSQSSTFACTVLILTICISCLMNAIVTRWVVFFVGGFMLTLVPQCLIFFESIGLLPLFSTLSLIPILAFLTRAVKNYTLEIVKTQVRNEELTERLEESLEVTRYLASRDALTGLLNRRAFEGEALKLADNLGKGESLALILIDLDYFKSINDTFGHAVGDLVLKKTASCLLQLSGDGVVVGRGDAAIARWGGEEFILVCPVDDLANAVNVAEDIRQELMEARDPDWPNEMLVTGSLGVALWEEDLSLDELINRADKAMYSAKVAGRNRTRAFHSTGHLPKQFFESSIKAS